MAAECNIYLCLEALMKVIPVMYNQIFCTDFGNKFCGMLLNIIQCAESITLLLVAQGLINLSI